MGVFSFNYFALLALKPNYWSKMRYPSQVKNIFYDQALGLNPISSKLFICKVNTFANQ